MDKRSLEPIFQLEEFSGLHPQAMENILGSLRYLLSLNTPSITLIVTTFIRAQYTSQNHTLAIRQWIATQAIPTPLALLEKMLKYCISEAWRNTDDAPYTSLALRKDIPLNLNQQSVHRALDMARRCDTDYSALQSAFGKVRTTMGNGGWNKWVDSARSVGSIRESDLEIMNDLAGRIFDENDSVEIPVLYIRIAYLLASNGGAASYAGLKYTGSPYAILAEYFDSVISRKLEVFYGTTTQSRATPGPWMEQHEKDKRMISILASRQTDWDAIYRTLQTSTVRGMARGI
ncbi:hypothetical protein TWF225_003759 [Orbilia oligospora]|uniref:Uncharacterized protein n=1 Tax=Orbilia oligospora TaxID=2813651 RepID=A0A7C8PPN5_ORBOL|nr:hypothetical protein TWF751_003489 [Orbilia oligospora]KAF3195370.1 hypothetical protein TWF225_003759 [Orbilia oligospora]KAF3254227.1 hypothetical protein TWF217_007191 [Orbilia oligospora]KAF3267688.1 hypothetical protein TWF128_009193 [Orbilia oligospora]TGJ63151.1 hypothetical protein EYR41_011092 [Orbilia oligospora]